MIYIMAHKAFEAPELPDYVPLQVGAALNGDLGMLRDDKGDNISAKNPYYCELTGLYWIWKNRDDAVKGLAHYRRYLTRSRLTGSYAGVIPFDRLVHRLGKADIILPQYMYHCRKTIGSQLVPRYCAERYFDELRGIFAERYSEFLPEFEAVFSDKRCCFTNMMVARREVFDEYCAWLFDILFELETRIKEKWPQDDPLRLYGYISERLLNVYVRHKRLRAAFYPMMTVGTSGRERLLGVRRYWMNHLRYYRWKYFQRNQ